MNKDPFDDMFFESHKDGKASWEDDDFEDDIPDFDEFDDVDE